MSDGDDGSDLLAVAEELYALPLGEFTAERDARVKALKGTDLAPRVKALRKPSLAAWVLNLLVRRETEQVEQVLAMGASLRAAQAAMQGEDLRELTRQRRQLTAAVTTRARALAREEGQRVTEAVAGQVEASLTAAMVDEGCAAAVRSGLLVSALSATGIGDVDVGAALATPEALGFQAPSREAPEPARPELRVVPDPDAHEKALEAAREEVEVADRDLVEARATLDDATSQTSDLEARSMQIQAEIDEARRRIADLEQSAEEVDEALEEAEEVREEARALLSAAEETHERAAAHLARLQESGA